jgi:hypothetical protein
MSNSLLTELRHLDPFLTGRESLSQLRRVLDKIEKCCTALDHQLNLADVVQDKSNYQSLLKLFSEDGIEIGLQLITRLALEEYRSCSLTLKYEISGEKKLDFLFRSLGGWKQFDAVLSFWSPGSLLLINPRRKAHWQNLGKLLPGTLITAHFKTCLGKRSLSQEDLAIERVKAVFELIQVRNDLHESLPAPVIQLGPEEPKKPVYKPRVAPSYFAKPSRSAIPKEPSMSFRVVINKMDTFVHAGNAHLIVTHLAEYPGKVEMFVVREKKTRVQLDADSIWGAEIRNGETVVFEFFGPKPHEDYVKSLANKTNKYTQMDKIANE